MKIQLDTKNKTIKIENNVKLSELVDTLEKLLPKGLWKEFELQSNVTINNWSSPIIIERETILPWKYTWYNTNNTNYTSLKSGVYNIEC